MGSRGHAESHAQVMRRSRGRGTNEIRTKKIRTNERTKEEIKTEPKFETKKGRKEGKTERDRGRQA